MDREVARKYLTEGPDPFCYLSAEHCKPEVFSGGPRFKSQTAMIYVYQND